MTIIKDELAPMVGSTMACAAFGLPRPGSQDPCEAPHPFGRPGAVDPTDQRLDQLGILGVKQFFLHRRGT